MKRRFGVRNVLGILGCALLVSSPTAAQECLGGTVYDDGSFEAGRQLVSGFNGGPWTPLFVQRFDFGPSPTTLDEVCVCWYTVGEATQVNFNLLVFSVTPSGAPGPLLGEIENIAEARVTSAPALFSYNATPMMLAATTPIFVGVEWYNDLSGIRLCGDESTMTPLQPAYYANQRRELIRDDDDWTEMGKVAAFANHRALGIRARLFGDTPPPVPMPAFETIGMGRTVSFQNMTTLGDSYEWSMGDGFHSTDEAPTHTYNTSGTYDVTLTATNQFGSASLTRAVDAEPDPLPDSLVFGPSAFVENGRFKIEATFNTSQGQTGTAQGAVYEDSSSFWHFFGKSNIELFAKVLNACGINGRFWVFLAGATNVGVEIVVTDLQSGATKSYANPIDRTFVTVTDTSAFATCP